MTNIEVSPAHVIRQYIWAVLKTADSAVWSESKYGGLVPIVPLNEEPELDEFAGPRIIYEYTHTDAGSSYFRQLGNMTMAIRDSDYRRLGRTLNTIETAMGRLDESARDINDFVERMAVRTRAVDYDISFGHVKVDFSQSGTPATEEGGMTVGIINFSFDFFAEYTVNTRPPV